MQYRFTLEISDNGNGISRERLERFTHSAANAGVGIAGMRARLEELGGDLRIASDNTGTTVTAELPVVHALSLSRPSAGTI